jgi:hypothetical protein
MARKVLLLVGTKKGGFIYRSDGARRTWELSEPILPGWTFLHFAGDLRDATPRLYAAANHWAWGPSVAKSTDLGATWDFRSEGLAFSPDMPHYKPLNDIAPGEWGETAPGTIGNVWNVQPGHAREPGVVYAGTQPAGLFRSEDWGGSWAPVEAINRHEYRKYWTGTGGGDSSLHSIHVDPRDERQIMVCVGAGGSYMSKDNGATFKMFTHNAIPTNEGAIEGMERDLAQFGAIDPAALPPGRDPAGLDELHRMRQDLKNPDRLWGMAHWGVFRSDDVGATWTDVTQGLPSFHGFPIAVTKREPDTAFVVPLDYGQDNFRVAPGQLAVYRTADSGASWERLTNGLPGPNNYQSAYREGLDTDGLESEGVYLGTSNGEVYYGEDAGAKWNRLPGTLPPVMSVTPVVIE